MVIYPIIFAEDPLTQAERVTAMVAGEARPQSYPPVQRFVAAIEEGLAGSDELATLLPQPHPENVVRGYLAALRVRLTAVSNP